MNHVIDSGSAQELAAMIDVEIHALPVRNTPSIRAVRRKYSSYLEMAGSGFILELSGILIQAYGHRGLAYELVRYHKVTFDNLSLVDIEDLGHGINSWWAVDSFGRIISGPAWLKGLIRREPIHRWAGSDDRWWRRAALVSTIALNLRSDGGYGDAPRTLEVCQLLVGDKDDMVIKAMSWALRVLAVVDADSARKFLQLNEQRLAARVKREVTNKLETGLKNPRRAATKKANSMP
jgi:3-methyladenine DNA glycosylase AlkD